MFFYKFLFEEKKTILYSSFCNLSLFSICKNSNIGNPCPVPQKGQFLHFILPNGFKYDGNEKFNVEQDDIARIFAES